MIIQNSTSPAAPGAPGGAVNRPAAPAAVSPPTRSPKAVVTPAHAPEASPVPPPVEVLDAAVSALNNVLRSSGSSLQFSVDRETDIGVVTVVDSNTGEVIRQIPSEEAIAIARSIDAFLAQSDASCGPGLLCKQVA